MFGYPKFHFPRREMLLWTADRAVFFVFNALAWITSERRAALVADWISHNAPRPRWIYMLVDATSYWIHQMTSYQFCHGCFEFVIEPGNPKWHKSCWAMEQQMEEQERRESDELDRMFAELEELRAEASANDEIVEDDAYTVVFDSEDDSDEDPRCPGCGNESCQGNCEEPHECPGGCGQPESQCTCAELDSLRRYNATPLEERCGPWTA